MALLLYQKILDFIHLVHINGCSSSTHFYLLETPVFFAVFHGRNLDSIDCKMIFFSNRYFQFLISNKDFFLI